mmetsp:Transcript_35630/g.26469  ORF Transcript_35630/g.26469 Transcript_35630/m.26469 type:complete len:89 (-) Transcript_35630:164-430(-)
MGCLKELLGAEEEEGRAVKINLDKDQNQTANFIKSDALEEHKKQSNKTTTLPIAPNLDALVDSESKAFEDLAQSYSSFMGVNAPPKFN